jgi:hypothetical protein
LGERQFELGTLIPLGAGVLKKDLLALALLARVHGTQIYGTDKCYFQNIEEISSESASLKELPYMAISCGANRGQRSLT